MNHLYTIGIDFGTQSGRAVLVRTKDGKIVARAECPYEHGTYTTRLPSGKICPPDFCLQDARDYEKAVSTMIRDLKHASGVGVDSIIGICIAATACSLVPVDEKFRPLVENAKWADNPHAYLKLWKHHGATHETEYINEIAASRTESFMQRYGGKCNSEWMFPKILEIVHNAPEVYTAAYRFIEIADWITYLFTGEEKRNSCAASYKAFWEKDKGYPNTQFFKALNPMMTNVVQEKLGTEKSVCSIGTRSGTITTQASVTFGLKIGTPVAVAHTDAHVAPVAAGIISLHKLLMIIGTSTCDLILDNQLRIIEGMSGVALDGIVPGLFAYEAGESAVGDILNWITTNCSVDISDLNEKTSQEKHIVLSQKAANLLPGESGLLFLDWWNGNRSILSDADLTGVMTGLTLDTKPEELYRAAIESTAYGQRIIIENFELSGIIIKEVYACGGIAIKNPVFMQIYADILQRDIFVIGCDEVSATGAAIFAAVAAGSSQGGYDSIADASNAMKQHFDRVYHPNEHARKIYDALYQEYVRLHDLLGKDSDVLKTLKDIKKSVSKTKQQNSLC